MIELLGKRINELWLDKDSQHWLRFETNNGPIIYITDGDCCSETWFADIVGVKALLGKIVNHVEELPMDGYNVEDGRSRQEYDQVYGYRLLTDGGACDIIFRNSSNGYYGGGLGLANEQNMKWSFGKVQLGKVVDDYPDYPLV